MKNISIVMATYNGAKYIEEQLGSIIPYLEKDDELIVSDDGSKDATINIIRKFQKDDSRIILLEGPRKGVVLNFENALKHIKGDIVLFSDQDDVWMPEKISTIRRFFDLNPNYKLLLHDLYLCSNKQIDNNELGPLISKKRRWRHGVIHNILFSCYYGCCMAVSKELLASIIPFSKYTIAYDQLIGLVAEWESTSYFLEYPLIKRRIHGNNMTKKLDLKGKIRFRVLLLRSFIETLKRN